MSELLMRRLTLFVAGTVLFLAGCMAGQVTATSQKILMHIFAYTPLEGATPEDFEAFKTATAPESAGFGAEQPILPLRRRHK